MKQTLLRLTMLGMLVTLPFSANAMMDEAAAYSTVQSMLASDSSAQDIIAALKEDGRTLAESAVFAMVSGGENMRVAFAKAGVALAGSQMEAQSVVDAVVATAGETGAVADALQVAMIDYKASMQPPSIYSGGNVARSGNSLPGSPGSPGNPGGPVSPST